MNQIGENVFVSLMYSGFVDWKWCYYDKKIYKSTVWLINIPPINNIFKGYIEMNSCKDV